MPNWTIETGFKSWGRKWWILWQIISLAAIGIIIGMTLLLSHLAKIAQKHNIDQGLIGLFLVIIIFATAIPIGILLKKFEKYSVRKRREEIAKKGGE